MAKRSLNIKRKKEKQQKWLENKSIVQFIFFPICAAFWWNFPRSCDHNPKNFEKSSKYFRESEEESFIIEMWKD